MKPGLAIAQSLPAEPLRPPGRQLLFPERAPVSRLRTLRKRLFVQGRLTESLQIARHLVERDPGRDSYFFHGFLLLEMGKFEEALRVFRDALRFKDGPAYLVAEIHLLTACTWYNLHDYKRMGEALNRAYALRPKARTDYKLHMTLGNHFLSQKDYRRALEEYERSVLSAPHAQGRGRALGNQAVIHYKLHDLDVAEAKLDQALMIHKRGRHAADLAHARMLRAAFWQDRGQHGRALSMGLRAARNFEKLGNLDGAKRTYGTAGYAAAMMGRWEQSRGWFEKTLALTRRSPDPTSLVYALSWLALASAKVDDFDAATRLLAEAKRAMRGLRDYVGAMSLYRAQAGIAEIFGDWKQVRLWARKAERYALKNGDAVRSAEFREQRGRAEAGLGRRRAALHAARSAARIAGNIGVRGSAYAEIRRQALRLAASDVAVLLTGENGVGKTALAREMHAASRRKWGAFVVAPCETLRFAASDFHGHEAGAWSGAREASPGLAGKAEGGTLLLDRIDELSAADQRTLIPLLEGRVRPVGSALERRASIRFLATCRRPERLLPELRQRLAAVLELPPLRERRDEIAGRVRALLGGVPVTEDALALLAEQPWAGNLAELEGVVQRLRTRAVVGVKAVRAELPRKPGRRVQRLARLAAMEAALQA